jgi:hypothetical protein
MCKTNGVVIQRSQVSAKHRREGRNERGAGLGVEQMVANGPHELGGEPGQAAPLGDAVERVDRAPLSGCLALPLLQLFGLLSLDLLVGQSVVCAEPAFDDPAEAVGHGDAG